METFFFLFLHEATKESSDDHEGNSNMTSDAGVAQVGVTHTDVASDSCNGGVLASVLELDCRTGFSRDSHSG